MTIEIPEQIKGFNFVLLGGDDGKKPIEKSWQKKIIRFDDEKLLEHLKKGFNYGVQSNNSSVVIENKTYFLIIIDFDNRNFQDKIINQFPETFATTSGSPKKCYHLWIASDNNKSFKVKDEKLETLADVLGAGNQVVAPGSVHIKSGSKYSIVKDIPIVFMPYAEIEAILRPHDKSPKKIEKSIKQYSPKGTDSNITEKIYNSISMDEILRELGVDTSRNPSNCPICKPTIQVKCMGWDDEKGHCFGCGFNFNKFSMIRAAKNLSDKETFEWFAEKAGMAEELKKAREKYKKGSDGNENTTTPILPTTPSYIKSWGYFDNNRKFLIEQIAPYTFLYNKNGKRGIITAEKIKEPDEDNPRKTKVLGFGFEIDGELFIIKNMFQSNLFYNTPSIEKCKDYLEGKFKPRTYKEIRESIKNILLEIYDFKDNLDVETCMILIDQSWIKPLLSSSFFFGIDSSFGGGKTTLGENIFFLMRHGFVGGDISSASIPRLVHELDLNIFVDEIDQNLSDENFLSILRKGQRRNNPYVRCEGRDNKPVAYDVFGCHGFSFRTELEDAFMNRALRIHSQKSLDYKLPILNTYKKQILKPLSDELFLWSIENLVATCSRHSEVLPISMTRIQIYNNLVSKFSDTEKEYLTKVFGRDAEITYLCLDVAKILEIDILGNLKGIMQKRKTDESSSESFYYDTLRDFMGLNQYELTKERLKDGFYSGCGFFPKNRLYQQFLQYLKTLNVITIGTKKFSSLLRDFGFVEGDTLMSERYSFNKYGTPCLIFSDKMLISLGLKEEKYNNKDKIKPDESDEIDENDESPEQEGINKIPIKPEDLLKKF